MPILLFVIAHLVRKMLQPISSLAVEIDLRGDEELHPVRQDHIPSEFRPAFQNPDRLQWVATRPSSLRIHRRKAVGEIPMPGSSQSSPAVDDPKATVGFLQSSRSAEPLLYEIECSEAAVRDLTRP